MRKAIRLFALLLMLAACGSTPVLADGGGPMPICPPWNQNCVVSYHSVLATNPAR